MSIGDDRPLTISLHALGGQGGGVVADWLISVGRSCGWIAQSTSVPGVAQRTGATVYYLELFRCPAKGEPEPIFALMPTPGDVDLVIASEVMEAGRAYNRGLITDRTTLVTSTSRVYAVSEKSGMGDARVPTEPVMAAVQQVAGRLIAFDMEAEAARTRSVISAVLLGAVAGSGELPFPREAYEEAIRVSGIAVPTNLSAFSAGFDGARRQVDALPPKRRRDTEALIAEGVKRLTDYQDRVYGELYLERLAKFAPLDRDSGELTHALARYLALWMSYEDTVRVADLKIRAARFRRVRQEVAAKPDQIVHIVEYLHPRVQEICDSLPHAIGAFALRTEWTRKLIDRLAVGRHVRTSSLSGFLLLYCLAAQRGWRRRTLRYTHENAKIERWLAKISEIAATDYRKAVELARCQRLIKGYGDTYDRGWKNFRAIFEVVDRVDASTLSELRAAALAEETGASLEAALAEHSSGQQRSAA